MQKLTVDPPNMMERKKWDENDGDRMEAVLKVETMTKLNLWSDQDREIFTEKYREHPKKFGLIASFLNNKVSITILPRTLNKISSQWLFSASLHIDC